MILSIKGRADACMRFCQNVPDDTLIAFNERSIGVRTLLELLSNAEWAGCYATNAYYEPIPCCWLCCSEGRTHDSDCLAGQILDIHRKHSED